MFLKFIKQEAVKRYCSIPCHYQANEIVFHENDHCDRIGIVLQGEIVMNHYTAHGDEIILSTLHRGDVFGDFLIFSSTPYYPGNLIAKTALEVITITKDALETLLIEVDAFRQHFLQNMSAKALTFNRENKLLSQPTIETKLLYWIESETIRQKNPMVYYQSKTILAQLLRVKRPSLSREMARLKNSGQIDFDRHRVWLQKNTK